MALLSCANISHSFGTRIILDGVSFAVEQGERVGLVGRNGCGKTTLMKIIAGSLTPDQGDIHKQRSARFGYLAQDPELEPGETLKGAAEAAFADLHRLHSELDKTFSRMAEADGEELETLLRQQEALEQKIQLAGGYAVDHRIDAVLLGLGFEQSQFGLLVSDLSGGQKSRLALARLLLEEPDLLLLDEPTNHLDISGRIWLEEFLSSEFRGAVLMVTHDRYMLDRTVHRIIEVEQGRVIDYPGNYSKFRKLREERKQTEWRTYQNQQTYIRQQQQFIARYKTGQRAKQARGRESKLDRFRKQELIEQPLEAKTLNLRLPKAKRSGDIVIAAEGLTKGYENKPLFRDLSLRIERGERWGVIGPNGAGKTTLIRCLLGEIPPDSGSVRVGSNVNPGYYTQIHDHLDPDLTVARYLQQTLVAKAEQAGINIEGTEQTARDLAGAFLFSGDDQEKELGLLSGGERARVVLAGLISGAHNLLVLDEPTNHLDIPSAERLEEVLSVSGGYQGTLILITHDRALLDATCDHLILLDGNGGCRIFIGTYSDLRRSGYSFDHQETKVKKPDLSDKAAKSAVNKKELRKQRAKERVRETDPLKKMSLRSLEERIEKIQFDISEIDRKLADPENYRNAELLKQLAAQRDEFAKKLVPLEDEWVRRAEAEDV